MHIYDIVALNVTAYYVDYSFDFRGNSQSKKFLHINFSLYPIMAFEKYLKDSSPFPEFQLTLQNVMFKLAS